MYWFFLCISSCTPEIYTSCHTLSLPYPLPISPPNFGQAPGPSPEPSTDPLFSAAEAKVPAAAPLSTPSEFDTVLSPFIARAFATGIGRSDAGIGPMAIVEAPDGGFLISGGANRGTIWKFDARGGMAGTPDRKSTRLNSSH